MYAECKRCRTAYVEALNVVRQVFPGARIIATSGIPQISVGTEPVEEERNDMSETEYDAEELRRAEQLRIAAGMSPDVTPAMAARFLRLAEEHSHE